MGNASAGDRERFADGAPGLVDRDVGIGAGGTTIWGRRFDNDTCLHDLRVGSEDPVRQGFLLAVALLFAGPAFAASVAGNSALSLAALVADRSPSLTPRERLLLAAYLDGQPKMGFPPGKKIIVRADAVICRISNVDITAKSCSLTFRGKTASIAGRPAHELYATLVDIGVASLGAAGSLIAGVKNLECTIDPAEVSQEGGGGANCTFAGNL